ncbi:MAG TPA: extracellular solute-binding protein [Kiritimatiellia bacterium]|nr:extracellular solute-binding protein [Kiritimatiellia bacterium]HPS08770.1 extracellular solute-binding protein [Kiritimatiellia bacterium]
MKIPVLKCLAVPMCAALAFVGLSGCTPKVRPSVVVYVSEDQVFSEPVLKDFERETGIRVRAVYDTEEAKSTGAMNRLIAEKGNPQADVYWANEPIRAEALKQKGISAPYASPNAKGIPPAFKDAEGFWTGFSARARVLIVHTNVTDGPTSVMAYAEPRWKGKAVITNPLFGTTTAEVAALFTVMGDGRGREWMAALKRNGVAVSTSNGESADFVADGRYAFSLVDSDDAVNRMRQGKPVAMVYPDQEEGGVGVFIVPNAVVLIKGAPHPEAARKLADYLLTAETERKLAFADCAQIPLHPGVAMPPELRPVGELRVMRVDYAGVARKMTEIQPYLKEWTGL